MAEQAPEAGAGAAAVGVQRQVSATSVGEWMGSGSSSRIRAHGPGASPAVHRLPAHVASVPSAGCHFRSGGGHRETAVCSQAGAASCHQLAVSLVELR